MDSAFLKAQVGGLLAWVFVIAFVLAGGVLGPVVGAFFGLIITAVSLIKPGGQAAERGRLFTLHALATMWFVMAGVLGLLRAAVVGVQRFFPRFQADFFFHEVGFGDRAVFLFDIVAGSCGALLSLIVAYFGLTRLWRQKMQIKNLAISDTHAAAIGLAAFKGVARPAEGSGPNSVPPAFDHGVWKECQVDPREAILFKGEAHWGNGQICSVEKCQPFYLEDGTGRIRVDPKGAQWWDGIGGPFMASMCLLHLKPEHRDLKGGIASFARLEPGEPVYVVGSVELRKDAPAGTADSERLVVRPRPKSDHGFLDRLLLLEDVVPQSNAEHTFFLSDAAGDLLPILQRALRWSIVTLFVWLLACVWLVAARTAQITGQTG